MLKSKKFFVTALMTLALICAALATAPGLADGGQNHQGLNNNYGVSGGNINNISKAFCCSGTLGALVRDSSNNLYILSANHILALSDQATPGDDISQPGLIDNNCQVLRIVADFSTGVPLGNNVDAAIAALRSGTMNTTGNIEDIGTICATVRSPSVGLSVAKSGRTTGFTTAAVGSIDTNVKVQYQKGCGKGRKFTITYTNQVVVNGSGFSAGGDSGSLIVTNDGNHQPVALLFAGSSSSTIGNPIGQVLSGLSSALGRTVSFVGGTCSPFPPAASGPTLTLQPYVYGQQMPQLPDQATQRAIQVLNQHRDELMLRSQILGVGVGRSDENDNEAAIIVYVDRTAAARPFVPDNLDGVKVRIELTDPFIAY